MSDQLKETRHAYLFGYPLKHSLAPLLHSTIFKNLNAPWSYNLIESIDKNDFIPKLKASDCIGAAVTMPHKVAWINECDEVTEEGHAIGAINTVYIRPDPVTGEKRYIGTNTDCIGVRESFLQEFPDVLEHSAGKPTLVIGGGGACRSAVYALHKWLGASEIYLVNRIKGEADAVIESFSGIQDGPRLIFVASLEEAEKMQTPVLIVGTVPDFPPSTQGEIVAGDIVRELIQRKEKGYVLEMCYHPNIFTSFYRLAEDNGWKVIPGTVAMVHQGIAQEVLWMERPLSEMPLDAAKAVIARALESR
ncbi:related to quinate 5-dehydrogenase [Fusarium torulosum]|uniref:Related to quinate 5-dehydrogenase n=1 Tax=Fusarium torulosum TaxID=33205 RepID=A0AAE8MDV0_9HYPO|nr:related to quinate 5-dehydrogenase [Fusarium torulosum]